MEKSDSSLAGDTRTHACTHRSENKQKLSDLTPITVNATYNLR